MARFVVLEIPLVYILELARFHVKRNVSLSLFSTTHIDQLGL
jgi:hypothetical protein